MLHNRTVTVPRYLGTGALLRELPPSDHCLKLARPNPWRGESLLYFMEKDSEIHLYSMYFSYAL